jgi:PEP-CTERM motif
MYNPLFFAVSILCVASLASAGPITYDVTVDTSSIAGTAGSLDFNFNPGPLVTQAASLQILNFASDGSLVNCAANVQGFCPTGDVSGVLPATLTFDNGTAFNDYFDGFTFGTTISFDVSLYGPALSAPDGVSTSGSAFAFSMFSDAAGTVPVLTADTTDGFAVTVNVNLDGTTTVTNFSSQTSVVPAMGGSTPEPSGLALLGVGLACVGGLRLRTRLRIRAGNPETSCGSNSSGKMRQN